MQDIDILTDQHDLRTTDNYCTFYARDYKQQLVHWFQLLLKMRSFKSKMKEKCSPIISFSAKPQMSKEKDTWHYYTHAEYKLVLLKCDLREKLINYCTILL